MIFITSSLELNGCTTFLLRVCREMNHRGVRPTVIVIFDSKLSSVSIEINQIARVIKVKNLLTSTFAYLSFKQLNVFFPLDKSRISNIFSGEIKSFHVMGVFGLILAKRLSKVVGNVPITIGVYHQNEFFYTLKSSYFHRWIFDTLSKTPWQNMIFFNDANKKSYSKHFNENFMQSRILPIGIELSAFESNEWSANRNEFLIISVGNLLEFKTYNKHVISCLPSLRIKFPNVRYEIYGEGYEFEFLKQYSIDLGVQDLVKFCGHLDYSLFNQVVSRAHVFVGSGTAVLESAALGVPSIIGIEAIKTPKTYGLISNIQGYSYNEMGLNLPLVSIEDSIANIFEMSSVDLRATSIRCINKAKEFDIETLVTGLCMVESKAISQKEMCTFDCIKLFTSFLGLGLFDCLKLNRDFRFRSNQSKKL